MSDSLGGNTFGALGLNSRLSKLLRDFLMMAMMMLRLDLITIRVVLMQLVLWVLLVLRFNL